MNKICGILDDYSLVKEDNSRIIVSYGLTYVDEFDNYTWHEVYFYKSIITPEFNDVVNGIIDEMHSTEEYNKCYGFVWNNEEIWLTSEHLEAITNAYNNSDESFSGSFEVRLESKFDEELMIIVEVPIFLTINNFEELKDLYESSLKHIEKCENDSIQEMENFDFEVYREFFE